MAVAVVITLWGFCLFDCLFDYFCDNSLDYISVVIRRLVKDSPGHFWLLNYSIERYNGKTPTVIELGFKYKVSDLFCSTVVHTSFCLLVGMTSGQSQ